MTQGLSGSFAINGTNLSLQPTTQHWLDRESYGIDGAGHPVYSQFKSYELTWQLISPSDFAQLVNFYNQVSNTGTVVVDLPRWGSSTYDYYSYSGCTLTEPTLGEDFVEHFQEAKMLILKIRV